MKASETAEVKPQAESGAMDSDERRAVTDKLIYNHVLGAMGIGLIPLPVVDMAALTALQIRLVAKISNVYGQSFSQEKAKNIISALIGSIVPVTVAVPFSSVIKFIPLVGHTISALIMPATSGAGMYAIGKVFVQHFESGGTFLTFDPASAKAHFSDLFKEGQKFAASLKKSPAKAAAGKAE